MHIKSVASLTLALTASLVLAGCEELPGEERQQGTVIGGVGGAVAGAALADEDDRVLGAIIGGALGAGGGYLIGREIEKNREEGEAEAGNGDRPAHDPNPGTITEEDVQNARSADLDNDGNVTVAELVAMERAGLTDREMLDRLEATDMVFDLNAEQRAALMERGISPTVVNALSTINRDESRDDESLGRRPTGR